jgi:hypothetical protein
VASDEWRAERKLRGAAAAAFLAALLILSAPTGAGAQAFKLQGGSSSLYHGHGGSMEMRGLNYTAQFNFGWLDGPRMGFSYATLYRGALVNVGDQAVPFSLPTDLFSQSCFFLGRGASFSWKNTRRSLFVYGGATSRGYLLPFFRAAEAQTGAGLIFFEQQLTPKLRFFSQNVVSSRQTSIQSLEWNPSDRFKMAVAGGIGSNERYAATTLDFDREWIAVQAGYTVAGDGFRRIRVESPAISETDRENIRVELRPLRDVRLVGSRNNYLSFDEDSSRMLRATVNGYSAYTSLRGLQLHGSFYDSLNDSGRAKALSFGARRSFGNRFDVSADYLRGMHAQGPPSSSIVAIFRETLTPRLTLTQVMTRGSGQTSFAFGGSYGGNRISAGVEYQTIYVPFAVGGESPFKQVLVLNVRLLLPGFVELNLGSDITPLGDVRYTGYATGFAYRGISAGGSSSGVAGGAVHPYIVHGTVVDQKGEPVRGAAILIGNELVFTDSTGYFSLRRKKAVEMSLAVALADFILPGNYEVVSAPERVRAARERDAQHIRVVLRRLANKPVPRTTDPSRLGVPKPSGAESPSGVPLLPVLELSHRISMSSSDSSLASLPPIRYKGRSSADVPTTASKAAYELCPQPVRTMWHWPANAHGPVAEQPVLVQYVRMGTGTAGDGTGDPGGTAGGIGAGNPDDLPGARRPCRELPGKRSAGGHRSPGK